MIRFVLILALIGSPAMAAGRMQFWNLTQNTIAHLYLAPTGTGQWSKDQCKNDPDSSVDPDERLPLTGVSPGHYDVRLTDAKGRTCLVRDVEIHGDKPYAFSLAETDLKDCSH